MLIGHEKGNDTQSRIKHNFGMGKPEGYRKAIRLMELAGRFGLPVVTLVDTSGAFPGIEAEERGQAEAIARSTEACLALPVPMVAVIVGEGGSGGAVMVTLKVDSTSSVTCALKSGAKARIRPMITSTCSRTTMPSPQAWRRGSSAGREKSIGSGWAQKPQKR